MEKIKHFDKEWPRIKRVYRKNATRKTKNAYCIIKFNYIDRFKYWFYGLLSKIVKQV